MKKAAENTFDIPKSKGNRPDCDPRLRVLINERKDSIESHGDRTTKRLTRLIKTKARKIKSDRIKNGLEDNMWDPVKYEKRGCIPRHTKIVNIRGQQVHDRLRAETFAEYYEHIHWAEDHEDKADPLSHVANNSL